ncbi:alpha/beta fold hydrolase [Rhodococcoides yunnanense]|uniref:alpha/beta fold hydrolase n=1 Tax=Rhodococcoides yunnanense TaxID=278209 RepID=UPI0009335AED
MIEAQYLEIDGRLAYVEQAGTGPAVLCIHTAGQSGVQWRHTITSLAELGYHVIVPDLPGHGRSEPASDGPVADLSRYADWCIRLLDLLEVQHPFVVGCSIGGKITLDIATKISDRLAGIVAMAADSHNNGQPSASLERTLEDASAPSRSDRTYYGTLACIGRSVSQEKTEMMALMHRREDPAVTTSDLIGWARLDLRSALPSISCPSYLVVGTDDFWLDIENVRRTADLVPGSNFVPLQDIGHYPMEEVPEFNELLRGWLETMTSARVFAP